MIPEITFILKSVPAGIWYFATALVGVAYLYDKDRKDRAFKMEQLKHKGFSVAKSAKSETSVYKVVMETAVMINADRAYIMMFHNGGMYQTGNDIPKISMTNEYNRNGTELKYRSDQWNNIIVSGEIAVMIDDLIKHKYQEFHLGETDFGGFEMKESQLIHEGLQTCYNFILVNHTHPEHPPIGIVSFYYQNKVQLSTGDLARLNIQNSKIQTHLLTPV